MTEDEKRLENRREELKNNVHKLIFQLYTQYGLASARAKANQLIKECEAKDYSPFYRGIIKGELGESILEAYLREFQKKVQPSVVVKGLCIPSRMGKGKTTEMDLCMFTRQRIYMFECKSYSGKKTLSQECFLKAKSTSKDVYQQSCIHMEVLNQYLNLYRINKLMKGASPFKLYLFELSSDEIQDNREQEWKERIPALTLSNLWEELGREFSTPQKINWDIERMLPVVEHLSKNSEIYFAKHMERMISLSKNPNKDDRRDL